MLKSTPKWMTESASVNHLLTMFLVAVGIVAILAAVLGYKLGHVKGSHNTAAMITDDNGKVMTKEQVRSIKLENEILKGEMSTLVQERDISLNNLHMVREELSAVKASYGQLEQLNDVLTKAMIKDGGIPLKVLAADIAPLPDNTFEYRFDVVMLARDGEVKKLIPKLTLLNETNMVEIPLQPSSYELKGVVNIRGRFVMPSGFTPKQMRLVLNVDNKHVEQLYNWRFGKANKPNTEESKGDSITNTATDTATKR